VPRICRTVPARDVRDQRVQRVLEAPLKRSRRTKIVATLGPASDTPEMIEKLFHAGADVFRINMSHLAREKLPERIEVIRTIEREAKRPIGILVDLQGPKLRLGSDAGQCRPRLSPSPRDPRGDRAESRNSDR
jgi:Pyruvate kinase, barrel domain